MPTNKWKISAKSQLVRTRLDMLKYKRSDTGETERTEGGSMEREKIIRDLHGQIENLTMLHIRHGLYDSEGFRRHREAIRRTVQEHNIDVRRELKPEVQLLYRRYFD